MGDILAALLGLACVAAVMGTNWINARRFGRWEWWK